MKLLINTASTHQGGAVQVAWSFISECRSFTDNEYLVILGPKLSEIIDSSEYPENFKFHRLNSRAVKNKWKSFLGTNFDNLENDFKPDVVFTTTGPAYWRPKCPHVLGFNLPHYIYPESPFFSNISKLERFKWSIRGLVLKQTFKRDGDAFVCQTDDVRDRVKKLLNTKSVFTVYNTYNNSYNDSLKSYTPTLPKRKGNEFRLLLLSSYHKHKNFEIIPLVLELLKKRGIKNIFFVITISADDYVQIFKTKSHPLVINIGTISIEKCPGLYQEIDAMFLPTLLECFSASYPEAMVSKKPILTSDLGFARTVCDDAALYFDPMNPEDVLGKILELNENKTLQSNLISKGLNRLTMFNNAKQRAESFLHICQKMID